MFVAASQMVTIYFIALLYRVDVEFSVVCGIPRPHSPDGLLFIGFFFFFFIRFFTANRVHFAQDFNTNII